MSSQPFKKSIFSSSRPKTSETTENELDVLQAVSYDRLFDNLPKKQSSIFSNDKKPQIFQNLPAKKTNLSSQIVEAKPPVLINEEFERLPRDRSPKEDKPKDKPRDNKARENLSKWIEEPRDQPRDQSRDMKPKVFNPKEMNTKEMNQREKEQREKEPREKEQREKEQREKEQREKEQREKEQREKEQREQEQREQEEREQEEREQEEREQEEREQEEREQEEREKQEQEAIEQEANEKQAKEQLKQRELRQREQQQEPKNKNEPRKHEHKNIFQVFEYKENNAKLPQKMDVSQMSYGFFGGGDPSLEIAELKALNQKYENKIDSLIAENTRMSNKLREMRQEKGNLPNIEAKLDSLLKENTKLTEIVKNQAAKLADYKENTEDIRNLEVKTENFEKVLEEKTREFQRVIDEKENFIKGLNKKIDGFKKEVLKANDEKSQLLEELMELKLAKNADFHQESEQIVAELKRELNETREANLRLIERLQAESLKNKQQNCKDGKIKRKIDNLQETFDNLAQLNEKLNSHLDAIQFKKAGMASGREDVIPEQVFQTTQKTESSFGKNHSYYD